MSAPTTLPLGPMPGLRLKAWAYFSVAGGVATLIRGGNVTSITYTAAGNYTVNFTNALAGVDFLMQFNINTAGQYASALINAQTVNDCQVYVLTPAPTGIDVTTAYLAFYE